MDTQITVFLALVLVFTLVGNAGLLWVLLELVRHSARKAARHQDQYVQTIQTLQAASRQLEAGSARLAEWSGQVRAGVGQFGDECERANNWLQYGLAKLDFNVDKASSRLESGAEQVIDTVSEPLYRTATIVLGVRALLELVSLGLPREDAGPRSAA